MSYNTGIIVRVISNRPRATCSADLKLLARFLPELYSTQSDYHYISISASYRSVQLISRCFTFLFLVYYVEPQLFVKGNIFYIWLEGRNCVTVGCFVWNGIRDSGQGFKSLIPSSTHQPQWLSLHCLASYRISG